MNCEGMHTFNTVLIVMIACVCSYVKVVEMNRLGDQLNWAPTNCTFVWSTKLISTEHCPFTQYSCDIQVSSDNQTMDLPLDWLITKRPDVFTTYYTPSTIWWHKADVNKCKYSALIKLLPDSVKIDEDLYRADIRCWRQDKEVYLDQYYQTAQKEVHLNFRAVSLYVIAAIMLITTINILSDGQQLGAFLMAFIFAGMLASLVITLTIYPSGVNPNKLTNL